MSILFFLLQRTRGRTEGRRQWLMETAEDRGDGSRLAIGGDRERRQQQQGFRGLGTFDAVRRFVVYRLQTAAYGVAARRLWLGLTVRADLESTTWLGFFAAVLGRSCDVEAAVIFLLLCRYGAARDDGGLESGTVMGGSVRVCRFGCE
ncbi:hypothetical protein M0R45_034551 [Rubus argutus]|uniref:Uncharacterized protein n=1 Tax=Rubus argutus TaxID=59490 RepID=A0AAW1VS69_RUBAR